jgi:hypothetical protein
MNATLARMAKPKKQPTDNVRMAKALARQARMVAAALDESLPDYLTRRLTPLVEEDLRGLVAGMSGGNCNGSKRKGRAKDSTSD